MKSYLKDGAVRALPDTGSSSRRNAPRWLKCIMGCHRSFCSGFEWNPGTPNLFGALSRKSAGHLSSKVTHPVRLQSFESFQSKPDLSVARHWTTQLHRSRLCNHVCNNTSATTHLVHHFLFCLLPVFIFYASQYFTLC